MLLTNNPNAPEKYGRTPINEAVRVIGHLNIVKILVNLTENPNAPAILGRKPIYKASFVTGVYTHCKNLGTFDRQS